MSIDALLQFKSGNVPIEPVNSKEWKQRTTNTITTKNKNNDVFLSQAYVKGKSSSAMLCLHLYIFLVYVEKLVNNISVIFVIALRNHKYLV